MALAPPGGNLAKHRLLKKRENRIIRFLWILTHIYDILRHCKYMHNDITRNNYLLINEIKKTSDKRLLCLVL